MAHPPKGASGNIDDIRSGSNKRRRIARRNTISEINLDIEREIDEEMKSPDHKKQKEQDTEEIPFICNTEILTELVKDAKNYGIETYGIVKLIECYNPMRGDDIELIKKHMLEYSGYGRENILVYKAAIEFVTNNDKDDISEMDIGELAEILIAAIKNRMTKYCEDCKNWYMVHRETKPKRECAMCKVGQHDCLTVNNEEKRSGDKWFCSECNEQFTNQNKQNKCRNIFFKGFEENSETKTIISETIEKLRQQAKNAEIDIMKIMSIDDEDIEQEPKEKNKEKEKEKNKEKNKKNEDNKNSNEKDESNNNNKANNNNTGASGNGNGNKRIICKYFLSSFCKFGNKCRNSHPDVCKEWATKGVCANINEDPQCKLAHPPKCRMFVCHRNNCKYLHPTNISKRKQNNPPMIKPQYQDRGFNINQQDRDFLDNSWPLPREASMSLRQFMAQVDRRMGEWDARWERMERDRVERDRVTRWRYY